MKRYKNLYPQIAEFEPLWRAWKKARRGKRYRQTNLEFEANLGDELLRLRDELRDETYQPGAYQSFVVHEPKRRKISAAPFRDRVVHHALINVLEPIYERKFIFDSYANRKGKGTHAALDRCTYFMQRYRYVLQCDIQQFFPAIDHRILKAALRHDIGCTPTLRLCDKIIDSGAGILNEEYAPRYFTGDDLFSVNRPRGLPIGNLTSQFWANVYLNPLDHFVKRQLKCGGYLRYVDDFLLFGDEKRRLHEWRDAIIDFLGGLRLTIHEKRAQPTPVTHGIPFLGFHVFLTHRRLKREKGIAYRRHLFGMISLYKRHEIERKTLDASVRAWVGHVMHGDTWGLRTALFGSFRL